jgi:hypothetical protein
MKENILWHSYICTCKALWSKTSGASAAISDARPTRKQVQAAMPSPPDAPWTNFEKIPALGPDQWSEFTVVKM